MTVTVTTCKLLLGLLVFSQPGWCEQQALRAAVLLPLFLLYFLTISARQIIAESTGQIFAPDFQDR